MSDRKRLICRLLIVVAVVVTSVAHENEASCQDLIFADQGDQWTTVARADFYTRDQGSRLIPYLWFQAITLPDGTPFLEDQLDRYGYLANPGNPDGLPVGFTRNDQFAGMTCAACHTRQIRVDGKEYRIDGGPAIVDAQALLGDINEAVGRVLESDESFLSFAKKVLGPPRGPANPNEDDVFQLKQEVKAWYLRYSTITTKSLPEKAWGPGRLDAVGMILNRVTGLDIGPPPSHIIESNIRAADAPVRYPFLWNAAKQDQTQWPGFADNGSDLLGLVRNLGEVYGVFADFHPTESRLSLLGVDYLRGNSANFDGLQRLEGLIKQIGPPKYPWPIDDDLAAEGKEIFGRSTQAGGCVDCHGIKPGKTRFFDNKTWATPLMDVGTDTREYDILAWTAKTGVLEGKRVPVLSDRLGPEEKSVDILRLSILGSILQHEARSVLSPSSLQTLGAQLESVGNQSEEAIESIESSKAELLEKFKLPERLQDLKNAITDPAKIKATKQMSVPVEARESVTTQQFVYESRVMEGIWAAAPYLHNGSVPTLADLLEPAEDRPTSFQIGPNYDIEKVGIAKEQTKFGDQTLHCDPNDRNSGDSNAGHEFGTTLSDGEKKALLEYLKTL